MKNVGHSPFKKKIILNVCSIFGYSSGTVKKTTSEKIKVASLQLVYKLNYSYI